MRLRIANSYCLSFPERFLYLTSARDECTGMAPIAKSVNGPRINTFTRITASHKTKEQEYKFIFTHRICLCLLQRTMIKLEQMLRDKRESRYLR